MNPVYLSAPVSALMKGLYEEDTTVANIRQQGDFGLGTFNDLNGEMIMLDGMVYQLKTDGLAYSVDDAARLPFACVTLFNPTTVEDVDQDLDDEGFKNLLERLLPSKNMFYAIRIDGCFSYLKVWSIHRQDNYRPITEVRPMAFDFRDMVGNLIGFYAPKFVSSLIMPGYHLHFLSADRRHGGHMFQCRLKRARISIQFVPELILNLPMTLDYLTADL
jgi:acetolactate decarboxylase